MDGDVDRRAGRVDRVRRQVELADPLGDERVGAGGVEEGLELETAHVVRALQQTERAVAHRHLRPDRHAAALLRARAELAEHVALEAADGRADDPLRARRSGGDRLAARVGERHATLEQGVLERAQVRLGDERGCDGAGRIHRVHERIFEARLAEALPHDREERRGERTERVGRSGEAPHRPGHDESYRSGTMKREEVDALEDGEQRFVHVGERPRLAVAIDRRADPAIALDRHVQVEPPEPVRERRAQRVDRVLLVVRGEERRESRADLGAVGRDVGAFAAHCELGRATHQRAVLFRGGAVVVVERDEIEHASDARRVQRSRRLAEGEVVHRRYALDAVARERRGHALHRRGEEVLLVLDPVEVTRERVRGLRVEAGRRLGRSEGDLGLVPGGAEGAGPLVLVAKERAEERDRVGVVVLVVRAVAEVERALVVDLDHHDRAIGPEVAREDRPAGGEPLFDLFVEGLARVARHRETDRHHRQHDGRVLRRARLARAIPHDALGETEVRELGVDVRSRPRDDAEPALVREGEEPLEVEARVARSEIERALRGLVLAPRHVDVDEAEAHRLHRVEAGAPRARVVAPVVHRAAHERERLASFEEEPGCVEADALRSRFSHCSCTVPNWGLLASPLASMTCTV